MNGYKKKFKLFYSNFEIQKNAHVSFILCFLIFQRFHIFTYDVYIYPFLKHNIHTNQTLHLLIICLCEYNVICVTHQIYISTNTHHQGSCEMDTYLHRPTLNILLQEGVVCILNCDGEVRQLGPIAKRKLRARGR